MVVKSSRFTVHFPTLHRIQTCWFDWTKAEVCCRSLAKWEIGRVFTVVKPVVVVVVVVVKIFECSNVFCFLKHVSV